MSESRVRQNEQNAKRFIHYYIPCWTSAEAIQLSAHCPLSCRFSHSLHCHITCTLIDKADRNGVSQQGLLHVTLVFLELTCIFDFSHWLIIGYQKSTFISSLSESMQRVITFFYFCFIVLHNLHKDTIKTQHHRAWITQKSPKTYFHCGPNIN